MGAHRVNNPLAFPPFNCVCVGRLTAGDTAAFRDRRGKSGLFSSHENAWILCGNDSVHVALSNGGKSTEFSYLIKSTDIRAKDVRSIRRYNKMLCLIY